MQSRHIRQIIFFILISLVLLNFAASANCQYEVEPHKNDTPLSNTTGVDGAYSSYWDLPLNVKILDFIMCLIAFIAMLKILPIFIGKIKDIYANKNRKTINIYVLKKPGSTIRKISNDRKISYTNARHHILILEKAGKITLTRAGKFFGVFPAGVYSDNEKKIIRYLNNGTSRSILTAISEKSSITNHELADICGVKRSSIHWHIERLLKDNIVRAEKDGKYVRYYIKDKVKDDLLKLISEFTEN